MARPMRKSVFQVPHLRCALPSCQSRSRTENHRQQNRVSSLRCPACCPTRRICLEIFSLTDGDFAKSFGEGALLVCDTQGIVLDVPWSDEPYHTSAAFVRRP